MEWCPLPLHRLEAGEQNSNCSCHDGVAVGTKLNALWEKFLSSPLVGRWDGCHCRSQDHGQKGSIAANRQDNTFKLLQYDKHDEPTLSEALVAFRPEFIKQSQLRIRSGAEEPQKKIVKSKKARCSKISEEERNKKRKYQAVENRIRVKTFQKEVLDKNLRGSRQ